MLGKHRHGARSRPDPGSPNRDAGSSQNGERLAPDSNRAMSDPPMTANDPRRSEITVTERLAIAYGGGSKLLLNNTLCRLTRLDRLDDPVARRRNADLIVWEIQFPSVAMAGIDRGRDDRRCIAVADSSDGLRCALDPAGQSLG